MRVLPLPVPRDSAGRFARWWRRMVLVRVWVTFKSQLPVSGAAVQSGFGVTGSPLHCMLSPSIFEAKEP